VAQEKPKIKRIDKREKAWSKILPLFELVPHLIVVGPEEEALPLAVVVVPFDLGD
jgi:hypothetical protein